MVPDKWQKCLPVIRFAGRQRIGAGLVLVGLVLTVGCRETPPEKSRTIIGSTNVSDSKVSMGGGTFQRTLSRDNEAPVRYTIMLPKAYDEGEKIPLVIALHFGGKVTPFFGESVLQVLYGPAFRFSPYVVVAPDSVGGPWTNEENEKAVIDLLDHLVEHYHVDPDRVVLTGYSLGGHGTWAIGGRHQDRFSALIPVASLPDPSIEKWTIPVCAVHSTADEVVPIGPVRKYIRKMVKSGADMRLYELRNGKTHYMTETFVHPVRNCIPWLKQVWERNANAKDTVSSEGDGDERDSS